MEKITKNVRDNTTEFCSLIGTIAIILYCLIGLQQVINYAREQKIQLYKPFDEKVIVELESEMGPPLRAKRSISSGINNDSYIIIHKESLGYYFITAYCPHECGYREYDDGTDNFPAGWTTASGEICHRATWEDRLYEPTTCAISRTHHSFGDLFYIEEFDRVFVAEDTGPGVQGRHLDLFYETYDEMAAFPTGYYEVFSVWYEEVDYNPFGEIILEYIYEGVTYE